ncbi:MAG: PEGA domain-containing protein [Deltaproteobacteria bacterium]|nr:PEGA domain-containing protein [Deltaproteobacteria bacterium]
MERIQKIYALRNTSILHGFVLPLFSSIWLCSCVTYMKIAPDTEKVALRSVQKAIPESELLDVRIQIFDPGELPSSKNASRGLSEEIRKAESHYMAIQLRNALQQSGHWGAVRVVPAGTSGDEVLVTGRILKSNGEVLKLKIWARDATGKQWFHGKTFKGAVSADMYKESSKNQTEVFQNVYNRIANTLAAHRQTMTSEQVHEIRQVAEMRFAEELAPSAFRGYLQKEAKKGLVKETLTKIDRLPSEDDEMLQRVRRVRERDYMLVDTLDAHYEGLHRDMEEVYTNWRKSRLDEMNMIRELEVDYRKNKERWKATGILTAGALLGVAAGVGVAMIVEAEQIAEEAEINKVALEEISVSFAAEVEPTILKVEGETIKLAGSANAKYQQWREVLARLYTVETGVEIVSAGSVKLKENPFEIQGKPETTIKYGATAGSRFLQGFERLKQKLRAPGGPILNTPELNYGFIFKLEDVENNIWKSRRDIITSHRKLKYLQENTSDDSETKRDGKRKFGIITINSDPSASGATIFIDGIMKIPKSPNVYTIENVPVGVHKITFQKAGYIDFFEMIEVREGEESRINVSLLNGMPKNKNLNSNVNSDSVSAKSTIDEIIKHLRNANLTFKAPEKMAVGEKRHIVLLMSMKLPLPFLTKELTTIIRDTTKNGQIYEASIKATKKMESHLTGFGFTIKPITQIAQLVKEDSSTRWEWIIRADEPGTQTLCLTVNAFIDCEGEQTTQTIQTFRHEILVFVEPATAFWNWLDRHIAWVAASICSMVTLFLGYYLAVLKERRKTNTKTTPK